MLNFLVISLKSLTFSFSFFFFFFIFLIYQVKCNNGCVFCRFLAFVPIVQLWNCKADKKHDTSPRKRVVSLKGVIRKKEIPILLNIIHLLLLYFNFFSIAIFIFSTIKTLRMSNLRNSKCFNFTAKIPLINYLFL